MSNKTTTNSIRVKPETDMSVSKLQMFQLKEKIVLITGDDLLICFMKIQRQEEKGETFGK